MKKKSTTTTIKKKSTAAQRMVNIRISDDLHSRLKAAAAALGVPMQTLGHQLLAEVMDEELRTNERLRPLRQMREAAKKGT